MFCVGKIFIKYLFGQNISNISWRFSLLVCLLPASWSKEVHATLIIFFAKIKIIFSILTLPLWIYNNYVNVPLVTLCEDTLLTLKTASPLVKRYGWLLIEESCIPNSIKDWFTCSKRWRKHSYVAIFSAVSMRESCSSSEKVEAHLVERIKVGFDGSVKGTKRASVEFGNICLTSSKYDSSFTYSWSST